MIFEQNWQGYAVADGKYSEGFDVTVPGNIQRDYGIHMGWGDVNRMDNCRKYAVTESWYWSYKSDITYSAKDNEKVYFVTKGIEYEYDIILNSKVLCHHEGMFSPVEIDITDELKNGNQLEILIYPHPKRPGATRGRELADQSVKPAVEYGWDWHPMLMVSGLWNDTYIETRTDTYIKNAEPFYTLSEDRTSADIRFDIDCDGDTTIEICDMDGNCVYMGSDKNIHLDNIQLWWCNGQGVPYLYSWKVTSADSEKSGRIGFKTVKLVMNDNAWLKPKHFPKTRSDAPITIELNGRRIFAKGSNWVNPEIFTGNIAKETYYTQVDYAYEAHMNIFRCWGGAIIDKDDFFDRCDEKGIMVWQEFPLACNNYIGTPKYLKTLEQEATAIIKRLRSRACLVMWCGGNELFNSWSGMTEQSHALRLLDKLCYEYDFAKPFIMTAPLNGMGHGFYGFYDYDTDRTVFEIYRNENKTAYSEFGNPAIAEMKQLKKIFTDEVIHNPNDSDLWELHHGTSAWMPIPDSWACFDTVDRIFGKQSSIEDYIEKTNLTECEGYKCIFEEARKQKGECSMVLNWCYNEPWVTAAGNSLIAYPSEKKPAYYAVQEALRDVMPSARFEHFEYKPGDTLSAQLWLLNDSTEQVSDTVKAYITIDGRKEHLITWETGVTDANTNLSGHTFHYKLPDSPTQLITVTLEAKCGNSEYKFLLRNEPKKVKVPGALNV